MISILEAYTRSKLAEELGNSLKSEGIGFNYYSVTDSTNTRAKEYAATRVEKTPVLFLAEGQRAGKGRLGRDFVSEYGMGVYMSLLLYPEAAPADALGITAYTAVILARVLERMTRVKPEIKWVNDIVVNGRKLAGILTEGAVENGALSYAIVGIGINISSRDWGELSGIATDIESCTGEKIDSFDLARELTRELVGNLNLVGTPEIAREYRERSCLIGKEVRVIKAACEYNATVMDITDRCELDIILENGERELLVTGEVSIKTK